MNNTSHDWKWFYGCAIGLLILFMDVPMITVALALFSRSRYFQFPNAHWSGERQAGVIESLSILDHTLSSLLIATIVATISTNIAFFSALAFARYDCSVRRLFNKNSVLPILFPQAVLGLALLLWFTALCLTPSSQATQFDHLVWIAPIATLIIANPIDAFDPAMEEAAFDLGACRWQILREVTLPLLALGIVSGFTVSFLFSWANFPSPCFRLVRIRTSTSGSAPSSSPATRLRCQPSAR